MMKSSREHEQLKTRRGKSREVSSRFLSPSASSSSPNRTREDDHNNNNNINEQKVKKKHDRLLSSESSKENCIPPSPWMEDDNVILPGRFSVDECALYRGASSSRRHSCSLLYELSDASSFASSFSTSSRNHNKPGGIKVSSKYLKELRTRPSKESSSQEDFKRTNSFRGIENMIKRTSNPAVGSSMSQWALSPGRSQAITIPSSNLKPPSGKGKGVGKLFNLGFDFFRGKNKSSSFSSPLKPKTYDAEAAHQLKLMNNRLVQWRFVNAKASAANNNAASQEKKQLLGAWDTLTKLKHLVVQERIKLQKKNLEMKLDHVLLSQVKHLEDWEDMEKQHFESLSMTRKSLNSLLSRLPLREGATVNIESVINLFQKVEAVTEAIMNNNFALTMECIVPLASQLAEVAAQEKLMLEQCHELLRMTCELEMQERSFKCCFLVQHKEMTFKTKTLASPVNG